jgi:ketosteroid isomerase-like protein
MMPGEPTPRRSVVTSPTTLSFDLDGMRAAVEHGGAGAAEDYFAEDIVWTEIDARTPPSAPARLEGRDAVVAVLRDAAARGIVSRLGDGFVAGDRAAVAVHCSAPDGSKIVGHALLTLRDGRIVRWDDVQAWDE